MKQPTLMILQLHMLSISVLTFYWIVLPTCLHEDDKMLVTVCEDFAKIFHKGRHKFPDLTRFLKETYFWLFIGNASRNRVARSIHTRMYLFYFSFICKIKKKTFAKLENGTSMSRICFCCSPFLCSFLTNRAWVAITRYNHIHTRPIGILHDTLSCFLL